METIRCSLNHLPIGHRGLVLMIEAKGMIRRRLLDLGLVPGTEIESVRKSPAGDPTAYYIRGAVIALRAEESRKVLVQSIKQQKQKEVLQWD